MGLTLIDGGGEASSEAFPWEQANLELIPDPSVIPPGMRLHRDEFNSQWVIKSRSGLEVLVDYTAMSAVSRAWSVYASMTTDFNDDVKLPVAVAVSQIEPNEFVVEFTGYGNIVASPEFYGKNHAMDYVQKLLTDIDAEDEYRGHQEGGTISLPQGFQLCTMEDIDYEHYALRVAGYVFNVLIEAVAEADPIDEVQRWAEVLHDHASTDTVKIVRTSYGPHVVEYGAGDDVVTLYADFSSYNEALRAVQEIKKATTR